MQDITIYDIDLIDKLNLYYYSNISYILFKLQKKIYEASKQCNLSLVHGLQKLLSSLYSIQLLAKSKVHKNALENNAIKKKYKIALTNEQFTDKILQEEINKKIIYWLLEAEWKAKIEFNSKVQKYTIEKIKLLHNTTYFKKIFYLEFKQIIYPRHIPIQYLILKLQSFKWINKQILSVLHGEYNIHARNQLNKFKKQDSKHISSLLNLLSEIIYIGFRWSIFRQTKANQYKHLLSWEIITNTTQILYFDQSWQNLQQIQLIIQNFLKKVDCFVTKPKICYVLNFKNIFCFDHIVFTLKNIGVLKILTIKPNITSIKNLTKLIKDNIYHKDKFGRIRANTSITLKNLINKLNIYLKMYQQYLSRIIDKSYLLNIACIIDEIIYRWMKKKYPTKINNKFLYKVSS
uniref:Uncharacterized protein n=1 Tax=Kumanoa americana TaxID=1196377 RepID=A0A1C9CGK9_9FLOR|nr:hypothetical protein Kuma_058 [Kumanoa americana]AOM67492.1 hypothetical protein Kuma_058 [Kumanoa americana]